MATPSEETPLIGKKRDPFLEKNFEKEQLHIRETHNLKYSIGHGDSSFSARAHDKILWYDVREINGWKSLYLLTGTAFEDVRTWQTCSGYYFITVALSIYVYFRHKNNYHLLYNMASDEHIIELQSTLNYVSFLSTFMLGLFTSISISRWWTIRHDSLGGLMDVISEITMRIAMAMPTPEDRPIKDRILRLCLLSHRLIYDKARGTETVDAFTRHHVDTGMMTQEELEELKDVDSKPQVVWIWICKLLHKLNEKGRFKPAAQSTFMGTLENLCVKALLLVGDVFTYIENQPPYPYVHMMVAVTIVTNILLSIKCGFVIGASMYPTFDGIEIALQVVQIFLYPLVLHAFLHTCFRVGNPFLTSKVDFPGYAYHCALRDQSDAFLEGAEHVPASVMDGV